MSIGVLLLVIAFLLFCFAASGRVASTFNLTAAGLACLTLAAILGSGVV